MTEITSRLSTALADRYKIERHLGEGGMATVYLAEDLKHKRKVAVKVLRPELAAVSAGPCTHISRLTVHGSRLVRIPPPIGALRRPRFDIVRARIQPLQQLIRALWPLSGILR